ncbi:hypothetical protein F5B20DRAFT_480077 [Whalleya microplaca]|nr:hypothetical protein F5B20DRAFT_480077 [Whalleya microplaca]
MITSLGRDMAIWLAIFTAISLGTLALRFYTLLKVESRHVRADDYLVVISVVAMLANDGIVIWEICSSLGAHTAELSWDVLVVHIKSLIAFSWTWTTATCTCKLAILCLYLEIFKLNKNFRRAVLALMAAWNPVLSATNCRPIAVPELISISLNLFFDLSIVLVPVPIIWKLQMPLRKKLAVNAMFSLGLGVIAMATWRLVNTIKQDDIDFVYDAYRVLLLSSLELWLGILAANLPTLAPLLSRVSTSKIMRYIGCGSSSSSTVHLPPRLALATFGGSPFPSQEQHHEFCVLTDDTETPYQGEGEIHSGNMLERSEFQLSKLPNTRV